jgi:bacterioferritin-associated ferredoxin
MIVCVCHRVSDRDIAIAASCAVFEESRVKGGAPRARGMAVVAQSLIAA